MDIEIRAARSKALLDHEHFIETMKDLRERQKDIFADSAASDVEGREEAHAIIRALNAIEVSLRADVRRRDDPQETEGTAPWKRLNRSTVTTWARLPRT